MRARFVTFVENTPLPFAQACARFGISRKTGYKWLNRFRAEGAAGLLERDRAPRSHPDRTPTAVEEQVLALAQAHPDWTGGRLRRELAERGVEPVPAWTTLQAIQRRARPANVVERRGAANDRWCLLMGPTSVSGGLNHRALVLQDEGTGFVLAAEVVVERGLEGCRQLLWSVFERQGLPRCLRWRESSDGEERGGSAGNGSLARHTPLTVELMRQGIVVEWGDGSPDTRPAVPDGLAAQLRKLPGGVVGGAVRRLIAEASEVGPPLIRPPQEILARWRDRLAAWADHQNHSGPAETAAVATPATRYRPSQRRLSPGGGDGAASAAAEPASTTAVVTRRISEKGVLQYRGNKWLLGRAFAGEAVQLQALPEPGLWRVDFADHPLGLVPDEPVRADGTLSAEGATPWIWELERVVDRSVGSVVDADSQVVT